MEQFQENDTTMHLINIPHDTQQEYQSSQRVRQFMEGGAKNATAQMRHAIGAMADASYREETLAFTELTTLNERMRNTSFISHEFYSINDRWCRASFIVVNRTEQGDLENVLFAVQLIDAEKRRELEYQRALKQAMDNQDEMYGEMLKMLGTGVIAYDVDTKEICLINDMARELYGFEGKEETFAQFVGMEDKLLIENKKDFIDRFRTALSRRGSYTCEYAMNNGKRRVYILSYTKIIVLGNGRRIALSSMTDVTEKRILEEQLRTLSRTDVLTQICNRRYGEQQIEDLLTGNVPGMFCLFDVNKFKSINDNYGHTTGDKALIAIADCMRRSFDKKDVLLRLGGDEFAVYAVGVEDEEEGAARIQKFFDGLEQIRIADMKDHRISVSLGAVLCNRKIRRVFDDIYRMADATMYQYKNDKGSQYGFYKQEADQG